MMNDLFVWPSTLNSKEKEPVEMVTNYSAIFWSLLLSGDTFIPPSLLWAQTSSLPIYHCSTDTADFIITSYLLVSHFKIKLWTMVMKSQEWCEIHLFILDFCHDMNYIQNSYCLIISFAIGFNFSLFTSQWRHLMTCKNLIGHSDIFSSSSLLF